MKFNQAVSCCSCSWPYFFTPHYISKKKKGEMNEKEKLDFIIVSPDNPHLSSFPTSAIPSTENADSLKSPNMSADSGFEGDNNRPLLLQPTLSLPKEEAICFWQKDVSVAFSMNEVKKSLEDSDFNESPLEKKSVPSICESDLEEAPSSNCETFTYCNGNCDKTLSSKDAEINEPLKQTKKCVSICSASENLYNKKNEKADIDLKVNAVHKLEVENEEAVSTATKKSTISNGTLEYNESDASLNADTSSAPHHDPSHNTDYYQLCSGLVSKPKCCSPKMELQGNSKRSQIKYLRSQSEPSQYTTVVKPKALKPQLVNLDSLGEDNRSSMESLHGHHHLVEAFSQRHERLSAFQERPSSSLSNNEGAQFFSRSLGTPPFNPSQQLSSSRKDIFLSETIDSYPANRVSSLNDVSSSIHSYGDVESSSLGSKRKSKKKASKHSLNNSTHSPNLSESSPIKRHSMPWDLFWSNEVLKNSSNYDPHEEPIHMTLEEVRTSLQTLDTSLAEASNENSSKSTKNKHSRRSLGNYFWSKKAKKTEKKFSSNKKDEHKLLQRKSFPSSLKAAITNIFGHKKELLNSVTESSNIALNSLNASGVSNNFSSSHSTDEVCSSPNVSHVSPNSTSPFTNRALPPLPSGSLIWAEPIVLPGEAWNFDNLFDSENSEECSKHKMDYAASIEKVKDCGWYWGPISGETAEKLLSNEPDGSFVVRDSSDEHYIFSLTFKLNGLVRHVRIEHDHGNFSFGCKQKFRSNTIVEFIENAVAHSRSGRYLFFLHRRPVLGPMQVQLLHPVSRFKHVQSLQHLCRFVILKHVRKDLIDSLPLPRRLQCYLNTPHYYSELALVALEEEDASSSPSPHAPSPL